MDAKILLVSFFLFVSMPAAWCATQETKPAQEPASTAVETAVTEETAVKPDPYADVTWQNVHEKNSRPKQEMTIIRQKTRSGSVVTVSSNADSHSDRVVAPGVLIQDRQ